MRPVAILVLALSLATPAVGQNASPPAPQAPEAPQAPASIDPNKLGVSLSRIQRGLRTEESRASQQDSPLRLEFQVQVFGTAPRIDVIQDFDLLNGDVPGSAPSHRQMIDFWTPKAFSSPVMPFSAMAVWAAQQIWRKSRKTECEEAIAQYRALLMQGVNVAAPRCTQ